MNAPIPDEFKQAAIVCSVDGCGFALTTEDTLHWGQTIGIPVDGVCCSAHPEVKPVRGWTDSRWVFR